MPCTVVHLMTSSRGSYTCRLSPPPAL